MLNCSKIPRQDDDFGNDICPWMMIIYLYNLFMYTICRLYMVIFFKAQELWYQSPISYMRMSLFHPATLSLPCKKNPMKKTSFWASQQAHRKAQSWLAAARCQMNRETWCSLGATNIVHGVFFCWVIYGHLWFLCVFVLGVAPSQ